MSIPPSKTVYASAVQLCPLSEASTPYETALDYNITYLDGFVDLREWAMLYYKSGKGNLKGYSNYIKKLIKDGKNPFTNYITIDPDSSYDTTLDGLRTLVLSDLGYTEEEVESLSITVVNPNYDETTWIKYKLDGFNWDDDNITIDGTIYTIKDYWFDNLTTIRVYLVDTNGNQIEKTVPTYNLLDSTSEPIVAQEYLYIEYEIDGITHVTMSPIPASGTASSYVYTAKNGSTFNYTKTADKTTPCLPMMPLKVGGMGMGWNSYGSSITEKRNLPKNSKFRNTDKLIEDQKKRIGNKKKQLEKETDEKKKENIQKTIEKYEEQLKDYEDYAATDNRVDLTGIEKDPHKCIKEYYHDSSETQNLYKKAEWFDKCENYDIYKKAMKRAGTTVESLMCSIYDTQCGFNDNDTSTMREQLYDCYQGYGCPMHAVKTTNVYTQGNNSFDSVYARLSADTKHPEIAAYAKYTRYTTDEIFETDKDGDDYKHLHFAEINRKKYKPMGVKAIAKYCFNYFDLYRGTSNGKTITVQQNEGYNYRATHSWKQYKKTRHAGRAKYRYCYDWTATKAQTAYLYEITYTGKMQVVATKDISTTYDKDTGESTDHFKGWNAVFRPVYLVKKYQVQVESEIDNDKTVYEAMSGIPITAKYYEQTTEYNAGSGVNAEYKLVKTERNGTIGYDISALNITMKRLYSLKETTEIDAANITVAGELLSTTYVSGTNYDGDGNVIGYYYKTITKGTYCTDKTSITTAIFDKGLDVSLLDYNAEVLDISADEYHNYSEDNDPTGIIRTDQSYSNFEKSLLPEKGKTYIVVANDDDWEGERIIFRYFHNINKWQYEEIRVEDYNIDWVINPREGGQHKAGSLSCLAPDGNSFLPMVIDVVKKLSFQDALVVYQYSSKEYWSYWMKKKIKVSFLNFVISIFFTGGIALIVAACSSSAYFDLMKGFGNVMKFVGLSGLLKLLGLENTIFGIIIEFVVNLVITILTAGAYLVVMIALALINLALNLYKYVIGRNQQDAIEDFQNKMQVAKDKQLELSNLNQMLSGGGLTLESIVKRVHRFANTINPTNIMKMFELPDTNCSNVIDAMVNLPANIPTRSQLYGA